MDKILLVVALFAGLSVGLLAGGVAHADVVERLLRTNSGRWIAQTIEPSQSASLMIFDHRIKFLGQAEVQVGDYVTFHYFSGPSLRLIRSSARMARIAQSLRDADPNADPKLTDYYDSESDLLRKSAVQQAEIRKGIVGRDFSILQLRRLAKMWEYNVADPYKRWNLVYHAPQILNFEVFRSIGEGLWEQVPLAPESCGQELDSSAL